MTLVLRDRSLAAYQGTIAVVSELFGTFVEPIAASGQLSDAVDVLWVTPKATQLTEFLPSRRPPLLNGIDHVVLLRRHYRHVVPGAARVEAERMAGMLVEHRTQFVRIDLPEGQASVSVAAALQRSGITCWVHGDEQTVLWDQLCFLAPLAQVTAAAGASLRAALDDAEIARLFVQAREGIVAIARLAGVEIVEDALQVAHEGLPAGVHDLDAEGLKSRTGARVGGDLGPASSPSRGASVCGHCGLRARPPDSSA